jgi:hypothetical protein
MVYLYFVGLVGGVTITPLSSAGSAFSTSIFAKLPLAVLMMKTTPVFGVKARVVEL